MANARVTFEGEGDSWLPDPSFIAEANATNRVMIPIGKTYAVHCGMPVEIVGKSDEEIETWTSGGVPMIEWPVWFEYVSVRRPLLIALACNWAFPRFPVGTGTCATEGRDEVKPLTLDEAKRVWLASYEWPGYRCDAVEKIVNRMEQEQERGTNLAAVAEIAQYLLDEALKIPEGTVKDFDQKLACRPCELADYLRMLSRFDGLKKTENLLEIAKTLSRFQLLEEVDVPYVMAFAFKVDDYLAYGTNEPPRRLLWSHRGWKGSACSHVHDVDAFRRIYNSNVSSMRKRVLRTCRGVIFDERDKSRDEAGRQALWEEFVRVSGGLSKE